MKRLLVILFMLVCFSAEAQKRKKHALPPPPSVYDTLAFEYRYEPLFTKEQLRRQFPYNKSNKVVLLSYTCNNEECRPFTQFMTGDTLAKWTAHFNLKNGTKDTLGYREVREVIVLTQDQTDSLNSMMHNMVARMGIIDRSCCYMPRNSILFLDAENKKIAFVDLCFECHVHKSSFEEFSIVDSRMYGMIKDFFQYAGLKYGVTEKD